MNLADKNTSILSISSKKITNCDIVAAFLQKNKIMCSVSENTSVVPYNGVYEIEKGCRISLNSHKPKLIDLKFWNSLKDEFGLTCAHLNVEGKFKGCIYDYLGDSACP